MKNLKNYGVRELNSLEVKEANGGWLWVVLGLAVVLMIAGATANDNNPDNDPTIDFGPYSGGGGETGPRVL